VKRACPELSRREVLAGACAAVPLVRHAGLDPASPFCSAAAKGSGIPDQVRNDGPWDRAAALYARAEAGLEAVAHTEDDDRYDRALGRHNAALARLLRTPAPDLAAVARKLDLILRHTVFELTFGEACLAALQRDVRRFARGPDA
jgi:hypothetical protein